MNIFQFSASVIVSVILLMLAACGGSASGSAEANSASDITAAKNAAVLDELRFANQQDFEDARRGFIAVDDKVVDPAGAWNLEEYNFIEGQAPSSVNPSLWRQAKLNNIAGLFKVMEGVYQVRGYDLANMSLIEGETGWIVVDPLTTVEAAQYAMQLVNRELGKRKVSAFIFTHSHIDHFGGVDGVLKATDTNREAVDVIVPSGFEAEAVSEAVLAGRVMSRRAALMYGNSLPRGPLANVGSGLGKYPSKGSYSGLTPTKVITESGTQLNLDGVDFEFQNAPHSEAPAELAFYLPEMRLLCGAEIVSRTMHNLYTLRGAKVRDALSWSGAIDDTLRLFGHKADVAFNSHHWPVWGNDNVVSFLKHQRDLYKFIHDQVMRLATKGLTPREIAETIKLPPELDQPFYNRGYYGTLSHNAKAVYEFYFGWYDGVPANLNPLPPVEEGKHFVEAVGGIDEAVRKGVTAIGQGNYRWAATLLQHAVFAHPEDRDAKEALAQAYEQMGYQAESGPWRNYYLSAALELRDPSKVKGVRAIMDEALLRSIPNELLLTTLSTTLDAEKAQGKTLRLQIHFTDLQERWLLVLENSVLNFWPVERAPEQLDATVNITQAFWLALLNGEVGPKEMAFSEEFKIDGSKLKALSFFGLLDATSEPFNIVTP